MIALSPPVLTAGLYNISDWCAARGMTSVLRLGSGHSPVRCRHPGDRPLGCLCLYGALVEVIIPTFFSS
eukprot:3649631-Alexandrium_andersonii.AAC.1